MRKIDLIVIHCSATCEDRPFTGQALEAAHRGYVMENGRVVMEDTAANLLQSDEVRSAYLGV